MQKLILHFLNNVIQYKGFVFGFWKKKYIHYPYLSSLSYRLIYVKKNTMNYKN